MRSAEPICDSLDNLGLIFIYRRQIISIEWATTPPSFNSISCAGANLGVLEAKISVLRQKLVIICATRAGANLGILAAKISVFRPKLVIICATRAGANLGFSG